MTPEQEAAIAAQDESTREFRDTAAAHDGASSRAKADALTSLRLGVPPSVVEKHSPFTGSYLRSLARDAGIEGDARRRNKGR